MNGWKHNKTKNNRDSFKSFDVIIYRNKESGKCQVYEHGMILKTWCSLSEAMLFGDQWIVAEFDVDENWDDYPVFNISSQEDILKYEAQTFYILNELLD